MPTGEERKLVTVFFAESGRPSSPHRSDPERIRAHLERFYAAMREEIEIPGGTVAC